VRERVFLGLGVLLFLVPLAANEWTVARVLSDDGELNSSTLTLIRVFDGLALLAAVLVVAFRAALARSFLKVVAIQLGTLIAALLLVEAAFYVVRRVRGVEREHFGTYAGPDSSVEDEFFGYRPAPGKAITSRLEVDGETVYDVTYTIDVDRRRVVPVPGAQARPASILFCGCSFTFGEGLEDDETLPYHVGLLTPGHRPWNLAYWGWGPQQMLAQFDHGGVPHEACDRETILVYTFIDNHVKRAIGSMRVVRDWGVDFAFYEPGPDDRPILRGTFARDRPLRTALLRLLGRSQMLSHLNVDVPLKLRDEHFELTASLLAEGARRLRETCGSTRFYVLIYPGSRLGPELIPRLTSRGVEVLDYSGLHDPHEPGLRIPGDLHPTPQANAQVAARLVADLGLALPPAEAPERDSR
jgi:hypothetical protein